jgi:hypothetical protein
LNDLIERSFVPYDMKITNLADSEMLSEFLFNQTQFTAGIEFDDSLAVSEKMDSED